MLDTAGDVPVELDEAAFIEVDSTEITHAELDGINGTNPSTAITSLPVRRSVSEPYEPLDSMVSEAIPVSTYELPVENVSSPKLE